MPDALEDEPNGVSQAVIEVATSLLPGDARLRLAALVAAKTARPTSDPTDQILVAHYILTGSGEFPTIEEQHRIEVRSLTSQLAGNAPDVDELAEETPPAPTEGKGWKGTAPS